MDRFWIGLAGHRSEIHYKMLDPSPPERALAAQDGNESGAIGVQFAQTDYTKHTEWTLTTPRYAPSCALHPPPVRDRPHRLALDTPSDQTVVSSNLAGGARLLESHHHRTHLFDRDCSLSSLFFLPIKPHRKLASLYIPMI